MLDIAPSSAERSARELAVGQREAAERQLEETKRTNEILSDFFTNSLFSGRPTSGKPLQTQVQVNTGASPNTREDVQ